MSAESILKRLNDINKKIEEDLPKAVAKEGMAEANRCFGVTTTATETLGGKGFMIQGTRAMIAEFGAGNTVAVDHPYVDDVGIPVYPGSYSEQHAKQYSTNGYWRFGGKEYTFVAPRMGMYNGMKYMKMHLNEIAERVFNQ